MAKRFLNTKTLEIVFEENSGLKLIQILKKYMPYQTILVVKDKNISKINNRYYTTLVSQFRQPIIECSLSKKQEKKEQIKQILTLIGDEVAGILVFGDNFLFDAVKMASSIKKICYIIMPTSVENFDCLLKTVSYATDKLDKFYKVVPPLALIVENDFILKGDKQSLLSSFASIASCQFFILDYYLTNVMQSKTLKSKDILKLEKLVLNTVSLDENLYNFKKKGKIQLIKNVIKCGLILQKFNQSFVDASTICAQTSKIIKNEKLKTPYLKLINSLFLANVYQSFVKDVTANNYNAVNISGTLKLFEKLKIEQAYNLKIEAFSSYNNKILYYKVEEFRSEILTQITQTNIVLEKAFKVFKRMSIELSYYLENVLDIESIKNCIYMAPHLTDNNNFLKLIKNFGVLNNNF